MRLGNSAIARFANNYRRKAERVAKRFLQQPEIQGCNKRMFQTLTLIFSELLKGKILHFYVMKIDKNYTAF